MVWWEIPAGIERKGDRVAILVVFDLCRLRLTSGEGRGRVGRAGTFKRAAERTRQGERRKAVSLLHDFYIVEDVVGSETFLTYTTLTKGVVENSHPFFQPFFYFF